MKLYTSLTRLKIAMNDGVLPPMTELTDRARGLCDPVFSLGMGALQEHSEKGLRCPIRGCGEYHHYLGAHLKKHGISTSDLKAALEIPPSVHFTTQRGHAHLAISQQIARRIHPRMGRGVNQTMETRARSGATVTASARLAGWQNLKDRCDAQLRQKLMTLTHRLGRSPTIAQVIESYGNSFRKSIDRIYGSFNACKEKLGFQTYSGRPPRKQSVA